MAEVINIQPINPLTFELQEYSSEDTSLITNLEIQTSFDSQIDKVEYFVYDLNNQLLYEDLNFSGYKLIDNILTLYPGENLVFQDFNEGQYNTVYNFISPKLASSPDTPYFISEISSDGTEIRLDTTSIPDILVISSSLELISDITTTTGSYYDFYLDFGNNNLVIAVNALLDTSSINNPTVLIKLYEPLPSQFGLQSQVWAVTQVAESVAYNVNINQVFENVDENIYLKGPNTNINVKDEINNSTDYTNYSNLKQTSGSYSQGTGSLQYQLNNLLAQNNIQINIDYSDYSNFIHFSSAQTRVENFYYKLELLQDYNYSASLSNNSSSGSYYVSSSNIIWQNKIDALITGFDNYEYYLYFNSGSASWPKTNSTPPYKNVLTTSPAGIAWFASQSGVAEYYDSENNNALTLAIPSYIRDDSQNAEFELFVEMIGQIFDSVFVYIQDVTEKYNADNRLTYGVSKDLVADILRDLGVKIYQNNFSSNDLYQALLGITPSGSLYNLPYTTTTFPVPTGSGLEYISTYVTASSTSSLLPTSDINKSTYKRIFHNIPYLLKKKGSVEGLRALITTFGIPDTILRINEFGGKDKNPNSYDNWQDEYNYSFYTSGSAYVSSSFVLNSTWGATSDNPQSVEFRFQTTGLPQNTASIASQSLWETDQNVKLVLKYTGSGYTSGSYSGSTVNPYYQYSKLDFSPDPAAPNTSASVYLPFYEGGWWSVLINKNSNVYTLYAKNKNYDGEDGNVIGFQASSSVTSAATSWNNSTKSYFGISSSLAGKVFTGSLQEIRYYTLPISESNFDAYVMNPYSIESSENLAFRATLGGELYTASISVHPKVTGSWVTTSSFASNSIFYTSSGGTYSPNTEVFYFDQVPAGIQNAISQKIKQQNTVLPYSSSYSNVPNANVLSPFISVQQDPSISQSYTRDIDYVEVAFSPQNEINEDINSQIGYFNLGDVIGDPRFQSSSLDTYPALDAIRDVYFQKYKSNYQEFDYIRLIEFFDNSLFKMLADWVPARTSLAAGIVIKNTLLDRNRYRVPQVSPSASIANIGSGSTNIPYIVEDQTITGSIDIGTIEGSNGGTMPELFGQTSSVYTYPGVVNIDQVWYGSTPSLSGSVPFTSSYQTEFFNGELSGSNLVVTTGDLSDCNVEIVQLYNTASLGNLYDPAFTYTTNSVKYDFDFEKTYYITFTENNLGGTGAGGAKIVDGIGKVYYNNTTLTSGTSNTVDKLQLNGIINPLYFFTENFPTLTATNIFVYESYIEPDCLVLSGDVQIERFSSKYMDVDFTTNQITAVNEQDILSGSATRAAVQDSNYTTARVINPRYNGSRSTSPGFNQPATSGSPIGKIPNVEQLGSFFTYFDWVGSSNPEYKNAYNVHVKFMVDEIGTVINPGNVSSSYYFNLLDSYPDESTPTLTLYNTAGSDGGSRTFPIIKPGVEVWPIVYTDSGSLGNGALSSINFNNGGASISVTNFFTTGASSPSVLTSSTNPQVVGSIGLVSVYNNGIPPYAFGFESASFSQVPVTGSGFSPPLPFTIQSGDEIRFSGSEDLVWRINSSSLSIGTNLALSSSFLYLFLDSPYTGSYPPNYFLIRRFVPNPSLVLVESTSSVVNAGGGTGFLLPQYPSQALTTNFNDIVQNLAQKNLI
jgi:hypothetical protein